MTGRIRENLYDCKLLQQKLGHLQVRNNPPVAMALGSICQAEQGSRQLFPACMGLQASWEGAGGTAAWVVLFDSSRASWSV